MSTCTTPRPTSSIIQANGAAFAKFGGRFLVRGGTHVVVAGKVRSRNIVLEFPSYAAAIACHDSKEYRQAAKLRDAASVVDLVIIEGYDGPQPG